MKAVVLSRQGTHSPQNEDACLAVPRVGVYAVADGVGGGPAGELASRTIVNTLYADLNPGVRDLQQIDFSIERSHQEVRKLAHQHQLQGMASTLVLAWCVPGKVVCFGVGDSRIYRYREGELQQLTRDHTTVVMKEPDRAKTVVTRALGIKPELAVDIVEWDRLDSDVILLMSDGVSDPLQDAEMVSILSQSRLSMADKADALIRASEAKGCTDDKTIVLAFS